MGETRQINGQDVTFHSYNTVVVGAGAAGMNCAVHLVEFMEKAGVEDPQERIAVLTAGVGLGASRMSGSDKQTYYKLGTSPDFPDSAADFAKTLRAAGCCHEDLAIVEGIASLRDFYHLVQAGVPFPTDATGAFIGYKTDHDPAERATSAGPKTSRLMSHCLQRQVERYGVAIFDRQEVAELLTIGTGDNKRIIGVVTLDKASINESDHAVHVFLAENIVLAAGGPGELYQTSVYPKGQVGIAGVAFRSGLVAENLTESQFGLASTKFRWNVSGTYMQAIPRIFSTDARGKDERDFLAEVFPTTAKMATSIFLKGYQWPFDPQRIEHYQSSLIDVLVFNETRQGRRVFMDFRCNPAPRRPGEPFDLDQLEPEAHDYLKNAGAFQETPIERLAHMNPPAIDIYRENGIDLGVEPLEIAVCAQHNNGGFAVNKWWESNVPHTFVIGEMAGTHGVKRPGGSALNAGQVGGLRTAEYIVNVYGSQPPDYSSRSQAIEEQLVGLIGKFDRWSSEGALSATDTIATIQNRMTVSAGHIRETDDSQGALSDALALANAVRQRGLRIDGHKGLIKAVQAEQISLASVAYLKAVVALLGQGSGSRGSHLVLAEGGIEIHPDVLDPRTGLPVRFKPENESLRESILQVQYDAQAPDLFRCEVIKPRRLAGERKFFEPAWQDYREARIYRM